MTSNERGVALAIVLAFGCGGAGAREGGETSGGEATDAPVSACEAGDAAACVTAGRAFETGEGAPVDDARALALYERGCDGGEARGCTALGARFYGGRGVARDDARARALFTRACEG
ncbi:MAG: hypothetical protein M5U28_21830 [Sandaracinaceae bacterium]|nr:hypothetical protein [Sandaracinaceae bacterium]